MDEGLKYKVGLDVKDFQHGVTTVTSGFDKIDESAEKTAKTFSGLGPLIKKSFDLKTIQFDGFKPLDAVPAKFDKIKSSAANAAPALFSLSQVARDLPFGFIAIQNNLPQVVDSFSRLSKESGGPLKAFKALGGAMLGPAGIGFAFSAVTSTITTMVQKYGSIGEASKALLLINDPLATATKKVAEAQDQAAGSAAAETVKINALIGVLANSALSQKQRINAYQSLKKEYPGLIQNMTEENALTKAGTDTIRARSIELIKYIKLKGQEQALVKLIEEASARQLKELRALGEVGDDFWKGVELGFRKFIGQDMGKALVKPFVDATKEVDYFSDQLAKLQSEITTIDPKITGVESFKIPKKKIELPVFIRPRLESVDGRDPDVVISEQFKLANIEVPLKIKPDLSSANKSFEHTISLIKTQWEQLSADLQNTINEALQYVVSDSISILSETIGDILSGQGFKGLKQIFNNLGNVLTQVGKYAIQTGVAMEAFKKAMSVLFKTPAGAIVAGVGLVALGQIMKNKFSSGGVGLAEGGVIPPGYPNDTFPARLSSREAVIPLDRLESMMGTAGAMQVEVTGRISGDDILFIQNRAVRRQGR